MSEETRAVSREEIDFLWRRLERLEANCAQDERRLTRVEEQLCEARAGMAPEAPVGEPPP